MSVKQKTIYTTDDGMTFDKKQEAMEHQKELDALDYKSLYFKLKKEYEIYKRNNPGMVMNNQLHELYIQPNKVPNPWERPDVMFKTTPDIV